MPYINFSEDDLYRANNADLVSYLGSSGGRVKRVGSTYKYIYTDGGGTHDSVTIHGGKWYDHKNQRGGYAVKFLQEFLGFSFQDAVVELLCGHCNAQTARPAPSESSKPVQKPFELPEANSDMRRVFAYLTKQRFIDPQIVSHFAHEHKIYEEKKYHNVVFVGTDENGAPKQASVRSTLSFGKTFRITIAGSDTNYSFSHFGNDEKLFVFEAPIDMLSFITLYQKDWQQHSYIAMNGVYESAVLKALESHSDLQSVYLCTDNDTGGIEAAERLRDILYEHGYTDIFRITPQQKDWNEMLKQRYGAEYLPAVPHERKELYLQSVEEDGYSQAGGRNTRGYGDGNSYANRGVHWVRGHFSRDGEMSGARRDNRGRYSRESGKDHMMEQLREMMEDATTERQRSAIHRCMEQIENEERSELMVTERELYEAIRECESAPPSYQNCEKLAVFYTVYDKLFANGSEKTAKSTDIQPVSDSEFMQLIVGKDWTSLLAILDELMDSVKILQPRLYDAVMQKLSE